MEIIPPFIPHQDDQNVLPKFKIFILTTFRMVENWGNYQFFMNCLPGVCRRRETDGEKWVEREAPVNDFAGPIG